MKKWWMILAAAGALFFVACGDNGKKGEEVAGAVQEGKQVSEDEIGLRTAPLSGENVKLQEYKWLDKAAGESEKIERAFENAPPMIPHEVDRDTLIITPDNNGCLMCHDPAVAEEVQATPVPASHLVDMRSDKKENLGVISNARFNCTQCHTPQVDAKPLVENAFKPDFASENAQNRSNLLDVLNEGVK